MHTRAFEETGGFASQEKAVQWKVGAGLVPGGGPMARLPRLVGRGRALEVLLGTDHVTPTSRSCMATSTDRCPKPTSTTSSMRSLEGSRPSTRRAIAETKRLVDVNSLPPDSEISPEWDDFLAALGRPAAQERIKTLLERGLQQPGDV